MTAFFDVAVPKYNNADRIFALRECLRPTLLARLRIPIYLSPMALLNSGQRADIAGSHQFLLRFSKTQFLQIMEKQGL